MPEADPGGLRALEDDPAGIGDDEVLYRIVHHSFVRDADHIPSQSFQDYPLEKAQEKGLAAPCASVAVVSVWRAAGADVRLLIEEFDARVGIVSFLAGDARRLKGRGGDELPQGFMMDPVPGHPWHAVMFDQRGSRTKAAMKAMPDICEWVYRPGELELLA